MLLDKARESLALGGRWSLSWEVFYLPRDASGRSRLKDAAAARQCLGLMHSLFLYLWPSKEGLCSLSAQEEGNPTWRLSPALGARREGSSLPARGHSDEVENEVKAEVPGAGNFPHSVSGC